MSVYEKLNKARMMFQGANVKKSGMNKYAGYSYFELSDILPIVNKICEEVKATCVVSFCDDYGELLFVDVENPTDVIRFTSPMSKATLKGCHEVQNLGAVETYIKRYLYQNCFEIAESDALDATMQPNSNTNNSNTNNGGNGNSKPNNTKPPKAAPKKWDKSQLDKMSAVLNSTYPDGSPVFEKEDKDVFNMLYAEGANFDDSLKQANERLRELMNKYQAEHPSSQQEDEPLF